MKYNKHTFGKSDLVEMMYRCDPFVSDSKVQAVIEVFFGTRPTMSQIRVWRHRIRTKGVFIPDGRGLK